MNSLQHSFLSLAQSKKLRCERFLDEMDQAIPWASFLEQIEPYYQVNDLGREKTDLELLLRIYFLQQWYSLSDPGAEEAIYDRISFQKFLGIDLLAHTVPDETTILNFRHLLESHRLPEKFFAVVNEILEQKQLMVKEGSIVDATIVIAPTSTKNQQKKRDPEMSSTKKGNTWQFGMKAHTGVDTKRGLVHTLVTTTARVHDCKQFDSLQHGKEQAVFGDKGYYSDKAKQSARQKGQYFGVIDRATRSRCLSATQQKRNQHKASVRAKVEFSYQVLKCQWHYCKVRYRGLFKNTMQLFTLFALCNLFRVRKQLLTET